MKCDRCGKTIRVAESIKRGCGPVCEVYLSLSLTFARLPQTRNARVFARQVAYWNTGDPVLLLSLVSVVMEEYGWDRRKADKLAELTKYNRTKYKGVFTQ